MRPPYAPPGKAPTSGGRLCHLRLIVPACGHDRPPAQDEGPNGHYSDSPDRSWPRGFRQRLRNPREFIDKSCLSCTLRPADFLWPAIVAVCGHNRVAAQEEQDMAIAAISEAIVAGWLLPNPPKALASPAQTSGTRKKIRGSGPLPGRKARQNAFLCGRDWSRMHQMGPRTGHNGRQNGASECGCSPAGSVVDRVNGRRCLTSRRHYGRDRGNLAVTNLCRFLCSRLGSSLDYSPESDWMNAIGPSEIR